MRVVVVQKKSRNVSPRAISSSLSLVYLGREKEEEEEPSSRERARAASEKFLDVFVWWIFGHVCVFPAKNSLENAAQKNE